MNAGFPPLEILSERRGGLAHLSLSLSGTGFQDYYISQRVELYRIVRIAFRWFIIPITRSRLLSKDEFSTRFGDLMGSQLIDSEEFWLLPESKESEFRARVKLMDLGNEFREQYDQEDVADLI